MGECVEFLLQFQVFFSNEINRSFTQTLFCGKQKRLFQLFIGEKNLVGERSMQSIFKAL